MSKQGKLYGWRAWFIFLTVLLLSMIVLPASAAPLDRPLPPTDSWAKDRPDDNGGTVDLGWSESPSPYVAAYRIYRAEESGGPYILLSERPVDSTVDHLSYADYGLTNGTTYYYVVTAVDREGRESDRVPELTATPETRGFEAAVTVHKSMVISIAEQKLYCMEDGRVVYVLLVSSGAGGTPTPIGNFHILYHDQAHPVPKYPGCICYYWMGFFEDYAIHAWPTYNGVQSNYEGLGYPASHGCVRLDPTQAHIPFYWAPNGTPLSIIPGPFQVPPAPIQGGHVSKGVSEASTTWYFAEGYTGGGFNEYILIFNPQEQATSIEVDMMLPDGSVHTTPFNVGPKTRITLNVDDFPDMSDTNVSVRVRSLKPVVAERAMYFDYNGKTGGTVSLGTTDPSTSWYFAEGYTGGGFDEYILILNPNAQQAVVRFDFLKPDGSVYSQDFPVGANSRATVNVDAAPDMQDANVSIRLDSDFPVVAERSMYFGYNGIDGGHVSTGSAQPSQEWFFPEGYTGGGFNEYILVLNPNDQNTNVKFDFMKPDGSVYSQVFPALANSRTTVYVDAAPGMDSTDVSIRLDSDLPVVAERSMYFGYPECPGGHVQTGYTETGNLFFLAEGNTSDFYDTYLLVMNPNDTELPVVVTFCRPDGTTVGQPMMVGPHSRASLKVNLVPGLSNSEFSIRVDTGGPAVVERAMYFNFPR